MSSSIEYIEEAGTIYREIKNRSELWASNGEILSTYTTYHDGKNIGRSLIASYKKDDIYKLVNNWNRVNRLQGTKFYYEASP